MEEWRGAYRVLVGEPEGKRKLGRSGPRWEDYVEMAVQEYDVGPPLFCSLNTRICLLCALESRYAQIP